MKPNKTNIFFISDPHLDINRHLWLGGLDKYTDVLAKKLVEAGYSVFFHEISVSGDFTMQRHGFLEIGHDLPRKNSKSIPKIQKIIKKLPYYSEKDIIIYSTDYLGRFNRLKNSIAIQHGIAWDIPFQKESLKLKLKPHFLFMQKIKIIKHVDKLICVDYNYPNWLRATYPLADIMDKITVVPNFTDIVEFNRTKLENNDKIRICFARRFEDYRGATIFADMIDLASKKNYFRRLEFVFAGRGKKEELLKKRFNNFSNVVFCKYEADESVDFHKSIDIAVIPTIGSEGTSLSALEAMSAGCAVISTSVGGLSNIIIDNYNGLIIEPNPDSILSSIELLINDADKMFQLQKNGHETVSRSFSQEKWFSSWLKVIEALQDE